MDKSLPFDNELQLKHFGGDENSLEINFLFTIKSMTYAYSLQMKTQGSIAETIPNFSARAIN